MTYELAPYATLAHRSKGRDVFEKSRDSRSPFQRDRDRIIHSAAFRRLQYKTQVLTNSEEGDFRTRLTHTLEVAQLSRGLACALKVDEPLAELCALAHDLGHPPFGHAGEDTLNELMKPYGGFEHNLQTIRILRRLECKYGAFDGLNLSWESLEGIAKHNGPLPEHQHGNNLVKDLHPETYSSIEAQIAAISDDIAYNHHDLDDGLATGKITLGEALTVPVLQKVWSEVIKEHPSADQFRQVKEMIRRLINRQMEDVIQTTKENLERVSPQSVQDVRNAGEQLVCFSAVVEKENQELKSFLFNRMYRHYEVNRQSFKAHRILSELFGAFMDHKKLLPPYAQSCYHQMTEGLSGADLERKKARVVCDYLANLTDRSAVREYARIFGEIRWS